MKSVVYLFLFLYSPILLGKTYGPYSLKDSLYGVVLAVELGDKVLVSCTGDFARIEFYPSTSSVGLVDVYLNIRSQNATNITGGSFLRFMSDLSSWRDEEINIRAEDAVSLNNPFEAISLSYDSFFNTVTVAYGYQGARYLDNIVRFCEYSIFTSR